MNMSKEEIEKEKAQNNRDIIGGLLFFFWVFIQAIIFLIIEEGEMFLIFLILVTLGIPGLLVTKKGIERNNELKNKLK